MLSVRYSGGIVSERGKLLEGVVCGSRGSYSRQQIPMMAIKTDASYASIIVGNVRDK
jgi:hypothetical protein